MFWIEITGSRTAFAKIRGEPALAEADPCVRTKSVALTGAVGGPMPAQGVLDLILELQLAFLEGEFFDLFVFAEVGLVSESIDAFVESVVLGDQLPEGRVGPQQLILQLVRVCLHAPPPVRKYGEPR
ncbi:MAG: hypothetical protein M3R55_10725 [Acidobacteriota bacterium]|nr:hypothetical protein [Acidobacteriota bacterium]